MKKGTLSMGRTAGQAIDVFIDGEHLVIEISKIRGRRAQVRLTASERVRIVRREALDKQGQKEKRNANGTSKMHSAGDS